MVQQYKQTFLIQLEILALFELLDNIMDECYNNKLLEKIIMQIGR